MRILFLLTQDLESPSGLGRYRPMAQELVRLGHQVTIAALHSDYAGLTSKRFDLNGVDVRYVAPMHVRKSGSQKTYYGPVRLFGITARASLALSAVAISHPADIIHIGKPHPMNSIAGMTARFLSGKRLFLDCDDYEAGVGNFASTWQKRVVAFFEDRMPFRVEQITTNTHFTRRRLGSLGIPPKKIVYISNGVDRARFDPSPDNEIEALRSKLGLTDRKVVGFIGSLSRPSHPVELLLGAFRMVQRAEPNSILLLVGGGDDLTHLQDQVQSSGLRDCVVFTGRVPSEQVASYYRLMHVSIDPVLDDDAARGRSPLKLFESWACGIPFISSDVGDRRFLLGDPPAGLLTVPGDPDQLARAILDVLASRELARRLSALGSERVKKYYWDRLAVELSKLYLGKHG